MELARSIGVWLRGINIVKMTLKLHEKWFNDLRKDVIGVDKANCLNVISKKNEIGYSIVNNY